MRKNCRKKRWRHDFRSYNKIMLILIIHLPIFSVYT